MPRFGVFDAWLRPKGFESERLYERLGAWIIKRYVPTGGDLVMRRLRRDHPERRWVTSSLKSLCLHEQRTRLNESIHLIGFTFFTILAARKFASGSLTAFGLTVGSAFEPNPRTVACCCSEIQLAAPLSGYPQTLVAPCCRQCRAARMGCLT